MISEKHPRGLPYIIGNEAAERFSYYGMRAILVIFMTTHLMNSQGNPEPMPDSQATFWYHTFTSANYLFPVLGALLADIWLGKFRTIVFLSLLYVAGHATLAIDETRDGLLIGLALIAIGAGGIKPCVSSHLGDQYTGNNAALVSKGYAYFYIAINVGAAASSLAIPWVYEHYGPQSAFAIPGILMFFATVIFWRGRRSFRTIPPTGWRGYAELRGEKARLARLALLFLLLSVFWSLFDQMGSSWVLQATKMDTSILQGTNFAFELLPAQIQAMNPLLILVLTPLTVSLVYPAWSRFVRVTAIHKMSMGMVISGLSFLVVAYAQIGIEAGYRPTVLWQAGAYLLLTFAEVMVSITSLEYAYTHAPRGAKALCMGAYFLSVSLGNAFTAGVNFALSYEYVAGLLAGPNYFLLFAALSCAAGGAMWLLSKDRQAEEDYVLYEGNG